MSTFEFELAHRFGPTYHASRNERDYLAQLEPQLEPSLALAHPPWKPYVYFCVVELGASEGNRVYEINYLTIWDWDSGTVGRFGAHQWDTERAALLIAGPEDTQDPEAYKVSQAYYAAHEGVKLGGLLSFDNSRYVRYPRGRERAPDVWWSKGKHASFPDRQALESSTARDSYDAPGDVTRPGIPGEATRPGEYSLVDAGALEQPSAAAPWIAYNKRWGLHRVSSVYSKLKDRLWDAAGNTLRDIPIVTEDEIRLAQSVLRVRESGQLDDETLQRAADILPPRRVWTTQKITRPEAKRLEAAHDIDVSPLL
ncbi:MAG: hypothetical protein GTO63_02210 [Anaerolineae bacterium]|nr:hypothetical protein [Anaerolineae bacterium]NIN93869.1 hypothetical protein [Anaerolineae bacterium]NIQ76902.1 hypothetical protein [Anaerolineae bacterium]